MTRSLGNIAFDGVLWGIKICAILTWICIGAILLIHAWFIVIPIGAIVGFGYLSDSFREKVKKKDELTRPCPHGVSGGKTQQLCPECLRNFRVDQARQQQEAEDNARRAEYRVKAAALRKQELTRLSMGQVARLDFLLLAAPYEFETIVADLFRRKGYSVVQTARTGDGGKDIILRRDSKTFFVECKRYHRGSLIDTPALRRFLGTMVAERADAGFFVTTSDFNSNAREFAAQNRITAINGDKLTQALAEFSPPAADTHSYDSLCTSCGAVSRLPLLTPHRNAHCICGESFSQLILLADLSTSNLDCMAPTCPRCGHKLRKVHGRNGVFFGCTTYPKCNFTRS
jgi:hypothetical protein